MIKVNEIVKLKNGMDGIVKSISNGKIKVNIKNSYIMVLEKDIIPTGIIKKGNSKIIYSKQVLKNPTVDLHGMIYSEATEALEKFLNNAFISNTKKLIIIHGNGNRVMKTVTDEILIKYSNLISYWDMAPQNLGGRGATLVVLK